MMQQLFVLPFIILTFFDLSVDWQDREKEILTIRFEQDMQTAKECVDTGLEYEQRFLFQACSDNSAWFRDCKRARKQIHKLSHDPIRKQYIVVTDLLGDTKEPISTGFPTLLEAFTFFSQVTDLPMHHMQRDERDKSALSVRIINECRGEYSETLAQLSYLLTLGLLDIGWSDSGWMNFTLDNTSE